MAWQVTISGHDGTGNPENDNLQQIVDAAISVAESMGLQPSTSVVNGTVSGVAIGPVESHITSEYTPPAAEEPEPELPRQNDTKDVWIAYAVSQGMEENEAISMSKAELVDKYSVAD
jgi:hypothetical protein